MRVLRVAGAFALAAIVAFLLGSVLHTQATLAGLQAVGAEVGTGDRLRTTAADVAGLAPSYGAIVGLALLLGFLVAAGLKRVLRPMAPVAYPLAGAAAIATALWLMRLQFETTPLASARSALGFLGHCLAGAAGGVVFAALPRRRPA